jgi:hypothetical protein
LAPASPILTLVVKEISSGRGRLLTRSFDRWTPINMNAFSYVIGPPFAPFSFPKMEGFTPCPAIDCLKI